MHIPMAQMPFGFWTLEKKRVLMAKWPFYFRTLKKNKILGVSVRHGPKHGSI